MNKLFLRFIIIFCGESKFLNWANYGKTAKFKQKHLQTIKHYYAFKLFFVLLSSDADPKYFDINPDPTLRCCRPVSLKSCHKNPDPKILKILLRSEPYTDFYNGGWWHRIISRKRTVSKSLMK